jgi:hypothetical protein
MFDKFYKRKLNLSRLNYVLISLIPKLKEANNIRQYRLICLLGVDYKWFTKIMTGRLTTVAESIISKTKNCFPHKEKHFRGVIILHETLLEMRRKKEKEFS